MTGKRVKHKTICDQLHDTYVKKNQDYGDSFNVGIDKWGYVSALVRMDDKFNRLQALLFNDPKAIQVKTESIADTALDLANYAIMLAMKLQDEEEQRKYAKTQIMEERSYEGN